ncbi:FtsX-like permease family protein [Sphingobacterium sp. DK4209]|uniref:FtsX-like permease family protein n=1 Tax=Sphingobacterium zhuxiongii TaxID=2662364 RepID=A0A5Q0Q5Y3_9SPHI|nr:MULTISPECIES: ABC transporter permease [unclassified Sphingobacterium]MVZ66677.1 FtsX-like permease family protein [Sphingobacterium sp. DK4209]QGA25447.1 FtsX-like permease family protein [Sphingobacterium sp. dk4302]
MFKIAFRNLKKNRGFTVINITGLAIGMAAAILIMLWVRSEVTFDRQHQFLDRIYVIGNKAAWGEKIQVWFWTPRVMARALETEFPEVEHAVRVENAGEDLLTVGENKLNKEKGLYADEQFFKLFNYDVISGDIKTALSNLNNIVITEELAIKLFKSTDVVGKIIKRNKDEQFTVSAVLTDIPSNSMYNKTSYFLSMKYLDARYPSNVEWNNNTLQTFVLLKEGTNADQFGRNMTGFLKKHTETNADNVINALSDFHLYRTYENGVLVGGRIDTVRVFILIAAFILLIACINFMNLSTAQSEKRAKEVGIRKVVGAGKASLIKQFLSESILLSSIAGVLALIIVFLALPSYSQLVDRTLTIPYSSLFFWMAMILFIVVTGLIAGSYPAFFLSSFKPIRVLKGKFVFKVNKFSTRKVLVVSQFVIAIVLIVSTIVIRKQIQYAQDREVGFNKERLMFTIEQGDFQKNFKSIKQELLEQGIASSVTRTMSPITQRRSNSNGFEWAGKLKDNTVIFNRSAADDKLVETMGLELIKGRDFDLSKYPTDSAGAIINETAAKEIGFKDPIGQIIKDGSQSFQVIGVIKDFIQESPYDPIAPLIIEGAKGMLAITHIKFKPEIHTREALDKTEAILKKYNPDYPFEYAFVDDDYAKKFDESEKTGQLASLFASLTIFISCLGLFGLSAFMAENKTKEIGIRKVLGASIFSVTSMLSKEFIILVIIACLIAFPIAYWAMNTYLSSYAYRISISWEIFAITAFTSILIAILTISYQSIKAAIANPINSLRDE